MHLSLNTPRDIEVTEHKKTKIVHLIMKEYSCISKLFFLHDYLFPVVFTDSLIGTVTQLFSCDIVG